MAEIDHTTPIPLYYQLKLLIKKQIEEGQLQPGDQIPTEAELCQRYNMSRTPVRQALLELVREGLLTRTVGRGTFVTPVERKTIPLQVIVPDARWQQPLEEAAGLWNETHTHPFITLAFTTIPLGELHDHLSLTVAQGKAPDISVLDSVWVAEFARRRYLCSLAELDAAWVEAVRDEFYHSVRIANCYKGEQYAVPTNADAAVLWYRRDWVAAEGFDPPTTWDELVSVTQHFRRPEVRTRYGSGAYPLIFAAGRTAGETTTYQLLPLLMSTGGDIIADEQVVLDSEATRRTLAFLRRLVHEEKVAPPTVVELPWDGTWRALARGEVALALGGTYENFLIQSAAGWDAATFLEHVGFVALPAGPNGSPATLAGSMTYGIYRQSNHSQEALDLLKLALTPAVLKPFSLQTGQNPAYIPVIETIGPDEDIFLRRTAPLFAKAGSRPSLPAYDRVSAQFQEMVELCLTDQLPVETAVRRTAERIAGITGLPLG
ncbi:MAG TPA: extracellular solute-binding protein [Anaerolineae bacterium]